MSIVTVRKRCGKHCDGVLCVGRSQRVIANTLTETSQFPETPCGTLTFPAGFFKAGTCFHVDLRGFINYEGSPKTTQRIKMGGLTIVENIGSLPVGIAEDAQTLFDFKMVCYSEGPTGSFIGSGRTSLLGGHGIVTSYQRALRLVAPVQFNTHEPIPFDVTYQWGSASDFNSLSITYASVTYKEIA